jgi:flagellar hook-length control protein FliK
MEASTSAAPSASSTPSASSGAAASARARKLAAAAAAGAESDTKPGFAELLGRRLDKARAGDDATSPALADEAVHTDAAAKPDDGITVAVPSDPGSAAWWAQRMRAAAHAQRPGAAAAADELSLGGRRPATTGASGGLESLAGTDGQPADAKLSAKAHSAPTETAFRGALDAAAEQAEDKAADSTSFARASDDAQATMPVEAMPKAAELSASSARDAALNTLVPTDGVAAARTDTPQRTPEPAALPSRDIAPPVASAAFAPALGEVMTLLLSEGTHEARLQLNPQELGPVTVKIELDGAQAHVHFVAGAAEAREALQAAMPLLQQALQESGLSLAGGGVFSQDGSGKPSQDGQSRHRAQKPLAAAEGPVAGAGVRQITRGVIDLYA